MIIAIWPVTGVFNPRLNRTSGGRPTKYPKGVRPATAPFCPRKESAQNRRHPFLILLTLLREIRQPEDIRTLFTSYPPVDVAAQFFDQDGGDEAFHSIGEDAGGCECETETLPKGRIKRLSQP
jgi:hypothetical protein